MNVDLITRPDDLVATRYGADVDRPERADENDWQAAGRYYASAADCAFWKKVDAEKRADTARRREQYEARQRAAQEQPQAADGVAPAPTELPEGVEATRLAAATQLAARPVGPSQYRVIGGSEPHYVALAAEGAALPQCDCADALYRPQFICKHVLAALAAEGDAEIRAAIDAVAPAEQRAA